LAQKPSNKLLGYSRLSLRDKLTDRLIHSHLRVVTCYDNDEIAIRRLFLTF
jgi:hypothetical protein